MRKACIQRTAVRLPLLFGGYADWRVYAFRPRWASTVLPTGLSVSRQAVLRVRVQTD